MSKKNPKIIVAGAAGRMGRAILGLAYNDPSIQISGAFEAANNSAVGRDIGELIGRPSLRIHVHDDFGDCVDDGNVLIDFTQPKATSKNIDVALRAKCAMVIGTTGLDSACLEKINKASRTIPIVQSPNMSAGVNLLFRLASLVADTLDERYDVEIIEEHHRHKKDAPSGTAKEIARLIAQARKINLDQRAVYGREGMTGERKRGTIGVHAVRGGDTIGAHQVCFIADGERLELVHRASSREAFAYGALLAAKYVVKKTSGLYNMQQVLGL